MVGVWWNMYIAVRSIDTNQIILQVDVNGLQRGRQIPGKEQGEENKWERKRQREGDKKSEGEDTRNECEENNFHPKMVFV